MLATTNDLRRRSGLCLALASLLVSGCAQTATVRHWQPASADVDGLHRVVVADFRGEAGPQVAAALNAELQQQQFFTLVDAQELSPVQHASLTPCCTEASLMSSAAAGHVDGVIAGDVLEYTCDDTLLSETQVNLGQDSAQHDEAANHTQFGFRHQQRLQREGTVTIAFRLVDTRTGEIRAAHKATHHYSGISGPGDPPLPPAGEVLDTLLDACITEFTQVACPHECEVEVALARPSWYSRQSTAVRSGNRLASRGEWESACDRWEDALASRPEQDAALYNLALAAAQRRDFTAAEDFAMRALQTRHRECYVQGLEEIRQQRADYEASRRQCEQQAVQIAGR
jgi:hypothetical protein